MAVFDEKALEEDEKILAKADRSYKFIIPHVGALLISLVLLIVFFRYDLLDMWLWANILVAIMLLGLMVVEILELIFALLNVVNSEFIITNKRLIYRRKYSREIEFVSVKKVQALYFVNDSIWAKLFGYVSRVSMRIEGEKKWVYVDTCLSNNKELERVMKQARAKKKQNQETA